jgi:phosphotransferase system HPr (HPr) family protein
MTAVLTPQSTRTQAPFTPLAAGQQTVRRSFVLKNRQGLHCRPAALLIKTLEQFRCTGTVEGNGTIANAQSLFDLMCLSAGYGTTLTFVFTGSDAPQAMAAVQQIFDTNFAAAY